jgi:hypothetical protein
MEMANKYKINETQMDVIEHVIKYTSEIGETRNSLSRDIQRIVNKIPDLDVPDEMDVIVDEDIIVAATGEQACLSGKCGAAMYLPKEVCCQEKASGSTLCICSELSPQWFAP